MAGTAPPSIFTDGDRVLCFHGPLIYEGKVLKQEWRDKDQKWFCFIHYAGWNKSWDEFVPEDRVLEYNEQNLQVQKEHKKAHEDAIRAAKRSQVGMTPKSVPATKKKGSLTGESTSSSSGGKSGTDSRSSTPVMDTSTNAGVKKTGSARRNELDEDAAARKRKRDDVESEQSYLMKQEVHIPIPDAIKQFLVDDWDRVCRQKQILKVPAQPTVDAILDAYLVSIPEAESTQAEFCSGLKDYFNAMLGSQLLYKVEQQQLAKVSAEMKDVDFSAIYGLAHLMRLLTKIGPCLAFTTIPIEGVELLQSLVEQFLSWVMTNYNRYFELNGYNSLEQADPGSA